MTGSEPPESPTSAKPSNAAPSPEPKLPLIAGPAGQTVWVNASDGTRLHVRRHVARGTCRGVIVGLHGIQSHAGWYGATGADLAAQGYDVWLPDRRGSGKSHGRRGDARDAQTLIEDVRSIVETARRVVHEDRYRAEPWGAARPIPVSLMGLSWGGRLASVAASQLQEDVDGLALLYPALVARLAVSPAARLALWLLAWTPLGWLYREIPLLDPALFTNVPELQQAIQQDSLATHRVTYRFLHIGEWLRGQGMRRVLRWRKPLLLVIAGDDAICDTPRLRELGDELIARRPDHVVVRVYEEAAHTIEFDPARPRLVDDWVAWLAGLSASIP